MSSIAGPSSGPRIDELVLDAGPLVTQQPLIGLAKKFYIPPAVVAELRDKRARDHLERLQQAASVGSKSRNADGQVADSAEVSESGAFEVEIREPGPEAILAVTAFAKKTGDYAVLSRPDMSVLALSYALEVQRHGKWRLRDEVGGKTGQQKHTEEQRAQSTTGDGSRESKPKSQAKVAKEANNEMQGPAHVENERPKTTKGEEEDAHASAAATALDEGVENIKLKDEPASPSTPLASDEPEQASGSEDDEEIGGEWITPDNIAKHKSRSLGLVTDADMALIGSRSQKTATSSRRQMTVTQGDDGWATVTSKPSSHASQARATKQAKASNKPHPKMTVACMTGDYAVQNVLLQMGLSLVGIDGQRIKQVKSWVLRCHACFKICKDADKTFCPQCGNPTLMRTSVTSTAPEAGGTGAIQVHLKKNFQYKNRGTKFSLPLPKAGKASGAPAAVPILREDQAEWQRGLARQRVQKHKEERALQKALERGSDSLSARYEDVDELSILLAGKAGKAPELLPALGVGRRNPNEKHRRKV